MLEKIEEEYNKFVDIMYAGKDKEARQSLGQFFTPPQLTVKMLEKLTMQPDDTLLDPCLGAGGLIAAAIVTGKAKPENCYGIELDPEILKVARDRLGRLGVPAKNLRWGNALNPDCYENWEKDGYTFEPNYSVGCVYYVDKNGKKEFKFGMKI